MSDFVGCIILESLDDESIMSETLVEDSKECDAPPGDRFTIWRQKLIRVLSNKADEFASRLSNFMTENFYAHYFNDSKLYVIFKNRFFVLPKTRDSSWDEMIEFGKTVGVGPEYTETIPLVRERLLG